MKFFKIVVFYWLPTVFWIGLIWGLSLIPDLRITELGPFDFLLRKIFHVFEFFVFTLLLARVGLRNNFSSSSRFFVLSLSVICALGSAAFDEWIQTFVPGRHGTLTDVGLDSIGILTALIYLLAKLGAKRKNS